MSAHTKHLIPIDAACAYDCEHASCIQIRTLVNTPCQLCGQTLGYETWWFDDSFGDVDRYRHETCVKRLVAGIEADVVAGVPA